MDKPVQIKSVDHLLAILDHSEMMCEFFILLNYGGRSWKRITYSDKVDRHGNSKLEIVNEIDETKQVLTVKNLMSDRYSNIFKAINNGAFYLYDGCENGDGEDND